MSTGRVPDLPDSFQVTRDNLHQVAFFAVSPTRYRAEGRMGLSHVEGGFGTPDFDGRSIRVVGDSIIDDAGVTVSHAITSVRAAVEFLGGEYEVEWFSEFRDPLRPVDPDRALDIDPAATTALGQWFGFGWRVLEELRGRAVEGDDPSEIQLWPEHFDAATELGDHGRGQRASYGASPGDANHSEPYVYVAAWSEIDRSVSYWNDTAFNGASLSYRELKASNDPVNAALEFLLVGHRNLHG